MAEQNGKVARPRHYTPVEREIFLDLLTTYKDIIENKKSDNVFLKKKEETWKKIESAFNSSQLITQQRTVAQLKKWGSNLKQHQRDAKTKEMQERLKTGGGTAESVADIDPQIEIIAPHLLVNAPILFSSNMDQDVHDAAIANLNIDVTDTVEELSPNGITTSSGSSPPSSSSATDNTAFLTQGMLVSISGESPASVGRKRKSSQLRSSDSSSGDDVSAKCKRIRKISEREEEVHRAKFAIELEMLLDKKAHVRKMQKVSEEASENVREAKAKADEAAAKAREAKEKADLAELLLKRAKEEDEMF